MGPMPNDTQSDDLLALVRQFLAGADDPLALDTPLRSLSRWESLRFISMVGAIEDRFGVEFDAEVLEQATCARSLLDALS